MYIIYIYIVTSYNIHIMDIITRHYNIMSPGKKTSLNFNALVNTHNQPDQLEHRTESITKSQAEKSYQEVSPP